MAVEIISLSISTKVWDRAGIKLATPGSAVRLASVARHITDCTTRPGLQHKFKCTTEYYNHGNIEEFSDSVVESLEC